MEIFSIRLKGLMNEAGMMCNDLSLAINIENEKIEKWLNGKGEPVLSELIKIAKFFNVKMNFLCGINNKKQRQ